LSGGNFIVKIRKIFLKNNAKITSENSLPLPRNRQKTEMISLNYDLFTQKSKSIELRTDLA